MLINLYTLLKTIVDENDNTDGKTLNRFRGGGTSVVKSVLEANTQSG